MKQIQDNILFSGEEWNAMVPTPKTMTSALVTDHLGTLHHGLCQNLNFVGKFQMPVVKPILCSTPRKIVAYYRTATGRFEEAVPHFFTDDRRFEHLWTHPSEAVRLLLSRKTPVIGPDFSVYAELVLIQKMWNIFRNKLLVAWWQYNGIDVIPNVSWMNESYECSFDGWPKRSVLAVNSTGVGNNERSKAKWRDGYRHMLSCLQPVHIIRYGAKQPDEDESISTYFPNDNSTLARHGW